MSNTLDDWLSRQLQSRLSRLDAQVLAQHALKLSRTQLITHGQQVLGDDDLALLNTYARRREAGEPVAYITGQKEFYSLLFAVNQHTLIPRPDTELLVDIALELLAHQPRSRVLDLGSGSGAIAIAVAVNAPLAEVTAIELHAGAIDVIQRNAAAHGLANLRVLQSNWFDELEASDSEPFDLILSNPPYVAAGDPHLHALRYEPMSALASGAKGSDGLDNIRAITEQAAAYLQSGGWLWLEHGYNQAAQVRGLLSSAGFTEVGSKCDISGIERVSGGKMQHN